MNQMAAKDICAKMAQALILLKEALDLSIPLLRSNQRSHIIILWEALIRDFVVYVRQKSKVTGVNLMGSVSLKRILFG